MENLKVQEDLFIEKLTYDQFSYIDNNDGTLTIKNDNTILGRLIIWEDSEKKDEGLPYFYIIINDEMIFLDEIKK